MTKRLRKSLNANTTRVSGAKGARGAEKMPRRSVTVTDENDLQLTKTRGRFMAEGINVGYTEILNMQLELGDELLKSQPWTDRVKSIIAKYIANAGLREEGVADEFIDIMSKKLWEEWQVKKANENIRQLPTRQ